MFDLGFCLERTKDITSKDVFEELDLLSENQEIIDSINHNETLLDHIEPIKITKKNRYYLRFQGEGTTYCHYNHKTLHETWKNTTLQEAKAILEEHFQDLKKLTIYETIRAERGEKVSYMDLKPKLFPCTNIALSVNGKTATLDYEGYTETISRKYTLTENNIARKFLCTIITAGLEEETEHKKIAILEYVQKDPRYLKDLNTLSTELEFCKERSKKTKEAIKLIQKMERFFQNPKP